MLCKFHLVEQPFYNNVLSKEDREGIVYQVKNWICSFTNYCEIKNKYKLSYKLLIEFMNRPVVFESMGPAYPYILDKYIL
jgi:DNA phosphorothioation-dependent restriction protein DptG